MQEVLIRVARSAAAAVLAAAAAGGCAGDAPEATRSTGFGFKGGIRLGVRITGDGLRLAEPGRLRGARAPKTLRADVTTAFTTPCPAEPCAAPARVRMRLAALYDLRTPLAVEPREIELEGGERTISVEITVPDRSPGRHCLLFVVAEPAVDPVGAQAPQHVNVTATVVEAGDSGVRHCTAPAAEEAGMLPAPEVASCPGAALSASATEMTARIHAERMWAYLPRCSEAAYSVLMRDEEFQLPAVALPQSKQEAYVPLPPLTRGGWRQVVVQDYGRAMDAVVSEPVAVP